MYKKKSECDCRGTVVLPSEHPNACVFFCVADGRKTRVVEEWRDVAQNNATDV